MNLYTISKEVAEIAHLKVLDICGRLPCFVAVTSANSGINQEPNALVCYVRLTVHAVGRLE